MNLSGDYEAFRGTEKEEEGKEDMSIATYIVNRRRGGICRRVMNKSQKQTKNKEKTGTYMVNRRARMVTTEYVFWGPSALAHGLPITP